MLVSNKAKNIDIYFTLKQNVVHLSILILI